MDSKLNITDTKEDLKKQIIINYLNKIDNPFEMLLPPDVSKRLKYWNKSSLRFI